LHANEHLYDNRSTKYTCPIGQASQNIYSLVYFNAVQTKREIPGQFPHYNL
jgi:hypothetical protein